MNRNIYILPILILIVEVNKTMGLITDLNEKARQRKENSLTQKQNELNKLRHERETLSAELELEEQISAEKKALAKEQKRVKDLKMDKWLGWLR